MATIAAKKSVKKSPAAKKAAPSPSLPVSKASAVKCAKWLVENFGAKMKTAVNGKAYGVKHLCAIVCQETAYKWVPWIGKQTVSTIVERAVFDASGDAPNAPRSAFPKKTADFRAKYGDSFTGMLIEEANKTRRIQSYSDKPWVYKGYGLFQFDLQHVDKHEGFFRNKQWYSFDTCLAKVIAELDEKKVKD